jgi:hypothetical protein
VCCGTRRLVEIRCPETCTYLVSARHHPPAVAQRQQARDVTALLVSMRDLTEPQRQLCFLVLSVIVGYEGGGSLQRLTDADVAEACGALASTYETASRGVIYEHRPQSLSAQHLVTAIREVLDEIAREAGARAVERDAQSALRSIASGATSSAAPGASAYLELLRRVIPPRPPGIRSGPEGRSPTSGLILPPA